MDGFFIYAMWIVILSGIVEMALMTIYLWIDPDFKSEGHGIDDEFNGHG